MPLVLRPPGLPGRIGGFRGQSQDGQEGLGGREEPQQYPAPPASGLRVWW